MAVFPEAGRLNKRITIQEPVEGTTDSAGQPTVTWSDVDTVWAWVQPLTGKEGVEAQQKYGEVTHAVVIRYRSDVTTKCRIELGARTLEIKALLNTDEENKELRMVCLERS